jgi:hypothetical protein
MKRPSQTVDADRRGRVAFAVGSGRCGTQFLQRVMALEPAVASWHEREPLSDSFARYCAWNDLPVDHAGFLAIKAEGIRSDLESNTVSFEASAYLSLHAAALHEAFGARLILLVRRPDRVVSSLARKGWYGEPIVRNDPFLAAGYQPGAKYPHHPFSRLTPRGEAAARWAASTVTGKLAWFWAEINRRALDGLDGVPESHRQVVRLEELDHARYRALAEFIGFSSTVSKDAYDALAAERPNTLRPARGAGDWSSVEVAEFEREVAAVAERLGYPWQVAELRELGEHPPATISTAPRAERPLPRLLRPFAR